MSLSQWWLLGRLDRLRDRRDDLEHELNKWGFSKPPSEIRAMQQRIRRLRERIAELEAGTAPASVPAWLTQTFLDHRRSKTSAPWYQWPDATRSSRLNLTQYKCKCGDWEGLAGEWDAHVADVLAAELAVREAKAAAKALRDAADGTPNQHVAPAEYYRNMGWPRYLNALADELDPPDRSKA